MIRGVLFIGATTILVAVILIVAGLFLLGDDADGVDNGEHVALGHSIYQSLCAGCHSTDGSVRIGPSFQGLYGSEVTMEDATTLAVDEAHIRESITEPQERIRQGFPDVMPPFDDLEDDEVDSLVAFIRSLE